MSWVLVIAGAWMAVAAVVAILVGRSIRLADRKAAAEAAQAPNFVVQPADAPALDEANPQTVPSARPPTPHEVGSSRGFLRHRHVG
jgi:hypothetical protein